MQVPTDRLVRLIEKMDGHVLDSAHLQLDIAPVSFNEVHVLLIESLQYM